MSNSVLQTRRCTSRLNIRGVDYAVHEWGDESKPAIFHLHGFADTGSTFQFVADELASDWHIIALDWRGFGQTKLRAPAYWFPDYLADLHAILEHYSRGEPAVLVGHSMGANIGSLYAGSMPERVAAFVNIEGFGLPDSDPTVAPDRYREWLTLGSRPGSFSTYSGFGELAERIRRRNPRMSPDAAEFVARQWGEADASGKVTLHADPAHKLPNAVLYRRAEAEACWSRITAPVLLVEACDSQFAQQFGDVSELPIPHTRVVRIPDCGHMIHFEQPVALAAEIHQFFTETL